MTLYDLAIRRLERNGLTKAAALDFLYAYSRGAGKDFAWDDNVRFLDTSLAEYIDVHAPKPETEIARRTAAAPMAVSVRAWRDTQAVGSDGALAIDDLPAGRASTSHTEGAKIRHLSQGGS